MSASPALAAPRSLAAVILAAVLLILGAILLPASPAHAHDELVGSDPAADATVETLPAQLTLTFSDTIATDAGGSEVQVTDAAGTSLVAGAPAAQDNVLTQPLAGAASGIITVLWKVVSSDGHPISGQFSFTATGAPTPTQTPTPTVTPTPTPTETVEPTPTPTPEPEPASGGDAWPWIIGGIVLVALAGGITYLLVSRARREKALAENREKALGGAPDGGLEPPADR
jgi:methionine-rich copper-binding protein CopC